MPAGYKIETIKDDSLSESPKNFTSTRTDLTVKNEALDSVDAATIVGDELPTVGQDVLDETNILEGYEMSRPGLLDLLVNKTLSRGLRSRTRSAKLRANYTIAEIPRKTAKAFTIAVISNEPGIVILKSLKELQQLPEAKQ